MSSSYSEVSLSNSGRRGSIYSYGSYDSNRSRRGRSSSDDPVREVGALINTHPPVVGASADVTLRGTGNDGKFKVVLSRSGAAGDTTTIKAYHIVQWNGKKYRLTQTDVDGSQRQQIGYTEAEWIQLAEKMIAFWESMKQKDTDFDFSAGNLNLDSKIWKSRASGESIATSDLKTAPYATVLPHVTGIEHAIETGDIIPMPMRFVRANPPPPPLADPRPQPDPPSPLPLPDPLKKESISGEKPWYKKLWKWVKSPFHPLARKPGS